MTAAQTQSDDQASTTIPPRCGVVGGGRMGAGIAHALLLAGAHVSIVERDDDAVAAARGRVERAVQTSVRRGQIEYADKVMGRLEVGTSAELFTGAGLVIEAVPEIIDLKVDTMRRIEAVLTDEAAIATNTSSLSLDAIGAGLRVPQRLIGLHFFNPVPSSKLVEVVLTDNTDPALNDRAVGWVQALGKTAVVVKNAPGFASSRLGVALGLEAIRMVQDGVASPADIDAAMTLGYGHPIGPLKLTDLVGIDVRLDIAHYLEGELGSRFTPPQLMIDMVERGHLGRKSGSGFYDWSEDA